MSRLPIHRASVAENDVRGILLDSLFERPDVAIRLSEAIESTTRGLSRQPNLGEFYSHPRFSNMRRVLVNGFRSYSIYYQVNVDHVLIVRVLHNSRDIESALRE